MEKSASAPPANVERHLSSGECPVAHGSSKNSNEIHSAIATRDGEPLPNVCPGEVSFPLRPAISSVLNQPTGKLSLLSKGVGTVKMGLHVRVFHSCIRVASLVGGSLSAIRGKSVAASALRCIEA